MKGLWLTIPLGILMAGCQLRNNYKNSFHELEFSYINTFKSSYSIKFTRSDTIYLLRYFPLPIKTFRGVLSSIERHKIDSFIQIIPFSQLDTLYFEPYEDGNYYQVYIKTDSLEKRILVHSHNNTPKSLSEFAVWLVEIEEGLKLSPVDTNIELTDNSFFAPPRIRDTIKYTVPKVYYH